MLPAVSGGGAVWGGEHLTQPPWVPAMTTGPRPVLLDQQGTRADINLRPGIRVTTRDTDGLTRGAPDHPAESAAGAFGAKRRDPGF